MSDHFKLTRAARGFLMAGSILVLAGCFRTVPVSLDTLRPQEQLRVSLSPQAAAQVAEVVGSQSQRVNARLVAVGPTEVSLLVSSAYREPGVRSSNLYQQVRVSRSDLLSVERRELDRGKTALVAGGAAAVAIAVAVKALTGTAGGDTSSPPGGGADARIPLLRLGVW